MELMQTGHETETVLPIQFIQTGHNAGWQNVNVLYIYHLLQTAQWSWCYPSCYMKQHRYAVVQNPWGLFTPSVCSVVLTKICHVQTKKTDPGTSKEPDRSSQIHLQLIASKSRMWPRKSRRAPLCSDCFRSSAGRNTHSESDKLLHPRQISALQVIWILHPSLSPCAFVFGRSDASYTS